MNISLASLLGSLTCIYIALASGGGDGGQRLHNACTAGDVVASEASPQDSA